MFQRKKSTTIKVTLPELHQLRAAEALETGEGATPSRQATLAAWHTVGEDASLKTMLLERAQHVLNEAGKDAKDLPKLGFHTTLPISLIFLLAFVAGALLEQITGDGNRLNLLAPPFLILLLWNLGVYAFGLLWGLKRCIGKASPFWLHHALEGLLAKSRMPHFGRNNPKGRLVRLLSADYQPLFSHQASRAFHAAALCFAVGILVSIAVRGIGTHWLVGWESSWFAGHPDWVWEALRATYGWVPGPGAFPGLETIASMEYQNAHFVPGDTPFWLMRLMGLIAFIVVLPRFLLILWHTLQLRHARSRLVVDLTDDYFTSILAVDRSLAPVFFVGAPGQESRWTSVLNELETEFGQPVTYLAFDPWEDDFEELAQTLRQKGLTRTFTGFSASETPEKEIHGQLLDTILEAPAPMGFIPKLFIRGIAPNQTDLNRWNSFESHFQLVIANDSQ